MKLAPELLMGLVNAYVIGDKAYDARSLEEQLQAQDCAVVIPSNPTRAVLREIDPHLYKDRCLVEHFFQRIKRFRRVAMRFEKLSRNFLAFVQLASVLVWLL
jgi:transposase